LKTDIHPTHIKRQFTRRLRPL